MVAGLPPSFPIGVMATVSASCVCVWGGGKILVVYSLYMEGPLWRRDLKVNNTTITSNSKYKSSPSPTLLKFIFYLDQQEILSVEPSGGP